LRALLVTGTCGSGKTTVTTLLAARPGWVRICEDDIWLKNFGNNRGPFGSAEHRAKRRQLHDSVFTACLVSIHQGENVVLDVTVHESPPEAYRSYSAFFTSHNIDWLLRVLHPRLEIAVERDAGRSTWHVGAHRVADLRAKFSGLVFGAECFLDNSEDTPEQTVSRLLGH
jgi:adenylate kinase family enzyme